MGLFNFLRCKFPLPDPPNAMELTGFNFNSLEFQTKDFDRYMDSYEIRADGTLWKDCFESKWVEGDKTDKSFFGRLGYMEKTKEWQEQLDYTGAITFYEGYGLGENQDRDAFNNDYFITYKAVFLNGKLIDIKLFEFEVTNNAERKKGDALFKEKMRKEFEFRNLWYIKYFYLPYERSVDWFFRKLSWLHYKLPPLYKIQRWLTPL